MTPRATQRRARHAGWSLAVLLGLATALAAAAEITVERAVARLSDDVYLIDASIGYEFSGPVLEALENAVPLTVELHVEVRREGAWVWEPDVVDRRLRSQIRYSPLLGTYQVTNVDSGVQRTFATREAAISALGEIKDLAVVQADALQPGENYRVDLRATLDIESLPLPLRPRAYLSPDWNLSSEWSRWRLRQ